MEHFEVEVAVMVLADSGDDALQVAEAIMNDAVQREWADGQPLGCEIASVERLQEAA